MYIISYHRHNINIFSIIGTICIINSAGVYHVGYPIPVSQSAARNFVHLSSHSITLVNVKYDKNFSQIYDLILLCGYLTTCVPALYL